MKIKRKSERWILGGYIPYPLANQPNAVHWFAVNSEYKTKRAAMDAAADWRERYRNHNKMPTFTLRREQVQTYREFF